MFLHLKHEEIDKKAWDVCIADAPNGILYALSWYLDIVSPQWEALVEVLPDGTYRAVMPLPVRTKWGIAYLQQPLFCQQLGIFGKSGSENAFFELLFRHFTYITRYACHTQSIFGTKNIKKTTHFTHHLRLDQAYEHIFKNYNQDRKTNLKRAQNANLQVIESENIEALMAMFRATAAQNIRGGVAQSAYSTLESLFYALKERKMCRLFYTADDKTNINAGALFTFFKGQIIYLFNAGKADQRHQNGRTLLIDMVIKNYAENYQLFDFESPQIDYIAYFYSSFGAKAVPFEVIAYNRLPFWIDFLRRYKP